MRTPVDPERHRIQDLWKLADEDVAPQDAMSFDEMDRAKARRRPHRRKKTPGERSFDIFHHPGFDVPTDFDELPVAASRASGERHPQEAAAPDHGRS